MSTSPTVLRRQAAAAPSGSGTVTSVVLVGLGSVGAGVAEAVHRRADCRVVGAVDIDPAKVGRDVGQVLGAHTWGAHVVMSVADLPPADVAFVATTSILADVEATLGDLLRRGYNVVSICEELGHPEFANPQIAGRLDALALAAGVSVLGTGCNPGMLMDALPLVMSSLTQRVRRIRIQRATQMVHYGHILTKFGIGLTPEEFSAAQDDGRVIGHVGFPESIAALGAGLGWNLERIEVGDPEPAFLTGASRRGDHVTLAPGTIAAVRHGARGFHDGCPVVDVEIHFGFFADGDPVTPGDRWLLEGEEQDIELRAPLGLDSLWSTVAVASNCLTSVVEAAPGLRTMADLPISAVAAKGNRRVSQS